MGERRRQRLAGLRIPNSAHVIPTCRGQFFAVRRQFHPVHLGGMSHRLPNVLFGYGIIHFYPRRRGTKDSPTLAVEAGTWINIGRLDCEGLGRSSLRLPNLSRAVLRRRQQILAVRTES